MQPAQRRRLQHIYFGTVQSLTNFFFGDEPNKHAHHLQKNKYSGVMAQWEGSTCTQGWPSLFSFRFGCMGVGDFDFFSVLNVFSSSFQRFPGSQCVSQDVPNSTTLLSIWFGQSWPFININYNGWPKGNTFVLLIWGSSQCLEKKLVMGKVAPSTKEKTKKTLSAHPTSFK